MKPQFLQTKRREASFSAKLELFKPHFLQGPRRTPPLGAHKKRASGEHNTIKRDVCDRLGVSLFFLGQVEGGSGEVNLPQGRRSNTSDRVDGFIEGCGAPEGTARRASPRPAITFPPRLAISRSISCADLLTVSSARHASQLRVY